MEKWKGTYIDNFLDCVKLLPNDLARIMGLIGELDAKCEEIRKELEQHTDSFLQQAAAFPSSSSDSKDLPNIQLLRRIRALQAEIYSLQMEKQAFTDQSRDMVQSFTARLDKDLVAFEQDLGPNVPLEVVMPPPRPKKVEKRKNGPMPPSYYLAINPPPRQPGPDEETYCYCRQVSHDAMVACDGIACPYNGWFHYKCVGLNKKLPPKDSKWYCLECAPPGWKDLFADRSLAS